MKNAINGGRDRGKETQSTFFFVLFEILESFRVTSMLNIFQNMGIQEKLPFFQKWTKQDNIFSFVRFYGINNTRLFAVKLQNIIGREKIFVNIPKFQRSVGENQRKKEKTISRENSQNKLDQEINTM